MNLSRRRNRSSLPFIHSTTLRNNQIERPLWAAATLSIVNGPAVLLPRVGRPDHRKIATLAASERVILSDCVIAIHCDSDDSAGELMESLIERSDILYAAYGGTCAPYLTVADLRVALDQILDDSSTSDRRIVARR
jgi:hypothetical protein